MGKVAFVFAGQGTQHAGMGRELYEQSESARKVFDMLEALRPGTRKQCFEGTEETLRHTANTQPCVFAVELAAAAALESEGVKCHMAAGFSLGEISALTYTGVVSLADGFRLVCRRGELMERDAEKVDSAMAAVVKLSDEQVERLCANYDRVYPVNYNCPGQIAVAGVSDQLAALCADVKEAGGRGIPLKVGGGFHSPFMAEAAEGFRTYLGEFTLEKPKMTLFSDYTARPYEGDYTELLSKQICCPVRWQSIVENMYAAGVDTFVELGPGKTLCGLINKTLSGVSTFNVEDMQSLRRTCEGVRA